MITRKSVSRFERYDRNELAFRFARGTAFKKYRYVHINPRKDINSKIRSSSNFERSERTYLQLDSLISHLISALGGSLYHRRKVALVSRCRHLSIGTRNVHKTIACSRVLCDRMIALRGGRGECVAISKIKRISKYPVSKLTAVDLAKNGCP